MAQSKLDRRLCRIRIFNKKKKRELTNEEIDENIFEMCNICSTTDCTGLIQVVPRTEAELESYEELYHFRPPFLPRDDD